MSTPKPHAAAIPAVNSQREAAAILGCSYSYVGKLIRDRKLRARRVGHNVRVLGVDIVDYLSSLPDASIDRELHGNIAAQTTSEPDDAAE